MKSWFDILDAIDKWLAAVSVVYWIFVLVFFFSWVGKWNFFFYSELRGDWFESVRTMEDFQKRSSSIRKGFYNCCFIRWFTNCFRWLKCNYRIVRIKRMLCQAYWSQLCEEQFQHGNPDKWSWLRACHIYVCLSLYYVSQSVI